MIRNKYANGMTISELADEYFLSLDSIKKIIYSKKNGRHIAYSPTLGSAVAFANDGMLEEWIQCYLQLTRKGDPALQEFTKKEYLYFGVVKFPLRLVQDDDGIEIDKEQVGEDPPPLLIQYIEGKFSCIVQKELLAVLKQRKVNAFPSIIVMKGTADYKRFMNCYGTVLFFVGKLGNIEISPT